MTTRTAKTVVITQSNYIPWRGYFDLIRQADEMILLDTVQYTRRDWRNRNLIRTAAGPKWLTIAVEVKGRYHASIDQTVVADFGWAENHIRQIETHYRRAAAFEDESPWLFAALREASTARRLSTINQLLLERVCARLGVQRAIRQCADVMDRRDLDPMQPSERLLALCQTLGASRYLSGPLAKDYLDVALFNDAGVEVVWMDYAGYPVYPQTQPGFDGRVSIIDVLLNCGADAARMLDRDPDVYARTRIVNS